MVEPVPTAVGVLVALVGGYVGLRMARRQWSLRREIKGASEVDAGALERGVVELSGRAVPAGETFTSPLTGQECVAYRYEVEERQRSSSGGSDSGSTSTWKTITDEERAAPFYVEDDTGRGLVDAPVAEFELERAYEVDSDDATASTAGKVLATITGGDADPDLPVTDERRSEMRDANRRRRYREHLVLPDESVYVYGEAMPTGEVDRSGGGMSSLAGLLAGDGGVGGSALGSLVAAAGGDTGGYRRAKRRGHENADFEDVGPGVASEEEARERMERFEELQNEDPEEMTEEERRRAAELAQEAAGGTTSPVESMRSTLDDVAEAVGAPGDGDDPFAREDLVVSRGDTIGEFVLSDREKSGVVRSYSTSTLKWVGVAVGSIALGGVLVAYGLGILGSGTTGAAGAVGRLPAAPVVAALGAVATDRAGRRV